jgi:hypothetical protein
MIFERKSSGAPAKPYLTPEGTKIFGGARSKSDDDGQ